jgi:hypothetical protein
MTGISFTESNFSQLLQIQGSSLAPVFAESNDWLHAAVSATLDSVGSGTATTSDIAVNSSLSLPVVSNDTFFIVGAFRNVTITALNTGLLNVSIPYQIQDQGPISGEWSSTTSASIQFTNPDHTGGIADGASFEHINASLNVSGETKTGIASITIPFTQGQIGLLNFDTRVFASVPEPETFWLLAVGLVLVGFVHRRRAYVLATIGLRGMRR